MRMIANLLETLYYYLESSYRVWKVRQLQEDDLVYTTKAGVRFEVYPGSKPQSPYDFIVKFREPGKRERTPKHVHLIVELYVKHAYNPLLTLKLKDHILTVLGQVQSINSFPPALQIFKADDVEQFKDLDRVGEFTVEFLLIAIELVAIQEKTNYPLGVATVNLYSRFGVKDRFSVIQGAVWRGGK
jgi:hypothetical protein